MSHVVCICSVIGYALSHSDPCVCVCVLVSIVPGVPVSRVWCSLFGCVSVCWYKLCIDSQSSVCVRFCVCCYRLCIDSQ